MPVHASWYGHGASDLEAATGARVAYLSRLGSGMLVEADTVLQDGDLVHLLVRADAATSTEATLAGPHDKAMTALAEGRS